MDELVLYYGLKKSKGAFGYTILGKVISYDGNYYKLLILNKERIRVGKINVDMVYLVAHDLLTIIGE